MENTTFLEPFFEIAFADEKSEIDLIISRYQEEDPYKIEHVGFDDYNNQIYLGGLHCLIVPNFSNSNETLGSYSFDMIYIIQLIQIYLGLVESYSRLFSSKMKECIKINMLGSHSKVDMKNINASKTLASYVVETTNLMNISTVTYYIPILNFIEKTYKVSEQRNNIQSTVNIFKEIQLEFHNLDNSRKTSKLNNIIALLTAMTCVSVISDAINTVDFPHTLVTDPVHLSLIIFIPVLLIIFYIKRFSE